MSDFFWNYFGTILELFWNYFGTIRIDFAGFPSFLDFTSLELFWNSQKLLGLVGTILELFWNYFGTICHGWNYFGTLVTRWISLVTSCGTIGKSQKCLPPGRNYLENFSEIDICSRTIVNYWRNFCQLGHWSWHLMPRILLSPRSEGPGSRDHMIRIHPRWFWKPGWPEMGWSLLILTSLALDLDQWTLILKLPGLGSDMILMILQMSGLGFCWFDTISLVSGLELGAVCRWFWCSRASDMKRCCCFLLVADLELNLISVDLDSLMYCHRPRHVMGHVTAQEAASWTNDMS